MATPEHIDLFLQYVYDELDAAGRENVDAMLKEDPDLAAALDGIEIYKAEHKIRNIEEHKSQRAERSSVQLVELKKIFAEEKKKPHLIKDITPVAAQPANFLFAASILFLIFSTVVYFIFTKKPTQQELPMSGGASLDTLYQEPISVQFIGLDSLQEIEGPEREMVQLIVKKVGSGDLGNGEMKYYFSSNTLTLYTRADKLADPVFDIIELIEESQRRTFLKYNKNYFHVEEKDFEEVLEQVKDPELLKYLPD